jgi:hypothetical protein
MPKVCTNLPNTESLLRRPKNNEVRSHEYLQPGTVAGMGASYIRTVVPCI